MSDDREVRLMCPRSPVPTLRANRSRLALLCLLAILLIGGVAPSLASSPPEPICTRCGDSFEETAAHHDVDLTVERSVATVRVHPNGNATWTVENRVDEAGAERLRGNPALLDELTGRNVEADVAADRPVVTLRYERSGFARRTLGGALVVTEFHPDWSRANYESLGADRLVVTAPDGMRVDATVAGATVERAEPTDDGGDRTVLTEYDPEDGRIVTFAPRAALPHPIPTAIATTSLVGPVLLGNLLAFVGVPVAVFAGIVATISLGLARLAAGRGLHATVAGRSGHLLVGVGVLVALSALLGDGVAVVGSDPPILGAGVGLVASGVAVLGPVDRDRATYRTLLGVAALGAAVAALAALLAAYAAGDLTRWSVSALPWLVPAFALIPAGYAVGRGRFRLALATATLAFAVPMVEFAPLLEPIRGTDLLAVFLGVLYALVLAVLGAPLLVAGASLATVEPTRTDRPSTD